MFNKIFDTLYNIDENNNVRVWWMEQEENKFRTVSGVEGGSLVTSEWKEVFGKNTGKKNATSDIQQATAEVEALYKKKLERNYYTDRNNINQGSKIIEPMLASTYKGWSNLSGKSLYCQAKLDGMRCIATKDGLFSREGKPIVSSPHIQEALEIFFQKYPNVVLDGELYNHHLKDDFNELLSIARKTKPTPEDIIKSKNIIEYHVYDNMNVDTFNYRNRFNITYLSDISPYIKLVDTALVINQDELNANYAILLSEGYEGQMIRLDAFYEHKRSKNLIKRKEWITEEFPVDEIVEGEGNWKGMAKAVKSHTEDGVEFSAQITGNQDFCRQLLIDKDQYKVVTIRYQNKTPDGSLRFATTRGFYKDHKDI